VPVRQHAERARRQQRVTHHDVGGRELAAEEILLPGERLLEHAERGFGPPAAAPGVSG